MSTYTFNVKYITKPGDFLIEYIKTKLKEDGFFTGIGQDKKYVVNRISSTSIYYTSSARNKTKQEEINISDLKTAIEELKKLPDFNSNTELLKERIPSSLYRMRTPLFGILTYTEVISEIVPKADPE